MLYGHKFGSNDVDAACRSTEHEATVRLENQQTASDFVSLKAEMKSWLTEQDPDNQANSVMKDLISGLENEPSSSSRDLAAEPGVSHTSVLIHLHQLDFVPRTKDRIHTYRSTSKQACLNLPSVDAKSVK
ncbi:hypothetical protein KIN20_026338 [Parelaphostrongylus tenuis]|uniref:Uncharacterized protein n=1 Tax=Parelaphostrongylus tenuis TaxID=148309 RepID=A0AAD5QXW8_PARTN|nr:hypothetical protein KIN20_026338 [Parelaphostrongylus tenuis]